MAKLTLSSVDKTATTYRFYGDRGWALCTVNDATGELLITSDHGRWAYRWNINHLGSPTLTAFIGELDSVDYLASKLLGTRETQFSAEKTARGFQRSLCARRLEDGRDQASDLPSSVGGWLSATQARDIWEELDCLRRQDLDGGHFMELIGMIDGFSKFVENSPWECWETEETSESKALREVILPPLIEACRATVSGAVHRRRRRHPALGHR